MTVFPLIFEITYDLEEGQLRSILIYNFSSWFTIVLTFLQNKRQLVFDNCFVMFLV